MDIQFEKWHTEHTTDCSEPSTLQEVFEYGKKRPDARIMDWLKFWKGEKIECLPFYQRSTGQKGHIFFFTDAQGNERSFMLEVNLYEKDVQSKLYDDPEEFEKAFALNMSKEHYLIEGDDPINKLLGFIVLDNDGATWHHISLVKYISYVSSTI